MDAPHFQTPPQSDAARRKNRLPPLAALIYSLLGLLWILFSDQLLFIVISDSETISRLQTYKGSGFVLITAVVFYILLRKVSSSQTIFKSIPVADKLFGRINTSIVRKGLALISIPLLFLMAFAWFALQLQQRYAAATELELHSKQVIAQTYRMIQSIDEATANIRGYVVVGDAQTLQAYYREKGETESNISQLRTLIAYNPQQEKLLGQIESSLKAISDSRAELIGLVQSGQQEMVFKMARLPNRRNALDQVHRDSEAFLAEEDRLHSLRYQALQRAANWQSRLLNFGTPLVILLTLVLVWAFMQSMLTRIQTLDYNARQLAASQPLAEPLSGTDELGRLDRTFHRMAQTLEKKTTEIEDLNKTLEAKVTERTQSLVAVNRDLHAQNIARQQAEESLRESEAKLHLIISQTPAMLWTTDADLRFTSVMGELAEQFNWKVEDIIGQTLFRWFSDEASPPIVAHRKALQGESARYELFTPVGEMDVRVEPFRNSENHIIGCIALANDVTEQKKIARQLTLLNEDLDRRVQTRTTELESANKELESFSYSVSHDLRAPLRAITGFAQILLEDHAISLNDEGKRFLNIISENARRMGALIDDLLSFSRIGRKPAETMTVDVAKLAQEIFAQLMSVEHGRSVAFHVQSVPPAEADLPLMRQVLTNLFTNAIKFTRRRVDAEITLGCQAAENETVYFIRDNGVGFDMQYANKLFGVFQRLHSEADFEGTGVGLAIVQRIIHRHGGRVWAESVVNEGATFYFSLPKKSSENLTKPPNDEHTRSS